MATMARLWALVIASISPVRPRVNSVMGMRRAFPPPAAVPLMLKVGPADGWRIHPPTFFPRLANPSIRPKVVVVLPSPRGVGVIAVISMYFPSGRSFSRS